MGGPFFHVQPLGGQKLLLILPSVDARHAIGSHRCRCSLWWRKSLLEARHGNVFYRARIGSRGWHCFFPVRDRTTQEDLRL
jgi:hypothetical protein